MILHRSSIVLAVAALALSLTVTAATAQEDAGGGSAGAGPEVTASAALVDPDGRTMGSVVLTEGPNGVLVQVEAAGLSPGGHGFHIHAVGACEPDFGAAGGHFDPAGSGHGFLNEGGLHAGDLPNIYAAADGRARADFFTAAVTLAVGPDHSLFDADGSALIIHALPDSYGESAGAGDRVGCGVVVQGAGAVEDAAGADDGIDAEAGPPAEVPAG